MCAPPLKAGLLEVGVVVFPDAALGAVVPFLPPVDRAGGSSRGGDKQEPQHLGVLVSVWFGELCLCRVWI